MESMRLAGAHEVRELLGVSRQRVYQLAAGSDFPKPIAVLAQGKIWLIDDIQEWIAKHRLPAAKRPRGVRPPRGVARPPGGASLEGQVRNPQTDLVEVGARAEG
jgi:predicted DNA-binding transcriptional regulator AlpA